MMKRLLGYSLAALSFSLLAACSHDDDDPTPTLSSSSVVASSSSAASSVAAMATYQITVLNATAAQPLGPVAAFVSDEALSLWEVGQPASEALEMLAESGSPDALLANYAGLGNTTNGEVTPPGQSAVFDITVPVASSHYLSLATMPVHTNDGFAGVQNMMISNLDVGMYAKAYLPVYDAGTEANTEPTNSVPGPSVGGTPFDAARDDIADQVTRHPGVVGMPEASDSALSEIHRFDSNSFIVKVMRVQ